MGFGQTMGFNYKDCGYSSAKEMYNAYSKSENEQIIGTMNFIINYENGVCLKALKNGDYDTFGKKYNATTSYSGKIRKNIDTYKNTK